MKYGVKLTVIDTLDYNDMENIANAIRKEGYKITIVENGNFVCEKYSQNSDVANLDMSLDEQEHTGSGNNDKVLTQNKEGAKA